MMKRRRRGREKGGEERGGRKTTQRDHATCPSSSLGQNQGFSPGLPEAVVLAPHNSSFV